MDAGIVSIVAVIASACAIGTFVIARMKDAEERGRLKQRIDDLEKNQDRHDGKIDKILEKLDFLAGDLRSGFDAHVKEYHRPE